MTRAMWFGILTACALASGCARQPVATYASAPVILISIDTLRADRLPVYGYKAGWTPHLDALARESLVFEDVYSPVPLTLPAHASLLTGFLPPRHGVRDNVGFTLDPRHATLVARLKSAGWRTGGATSAYVLRRQTGIAQGFDFFDDALEVEGEIDALGAIQRDGAETVDRLSEWIDKGAGERFAAFLHLYEPHTPYAPPDRYKGAATPYDGEVSYADELVGRFLDRLKARNLYDRAIVAVVSDHGEGLNDHGEDEHGIFLYREAIHVPFLLRLPEAVRGGERIGGSVSLLDVMPTIVDLAGVSISGTDGVSLRKAIDEGKAVPRRVYSETLYPRYHFGWSELYAATEGPFRVIKAPRPEFYDLRNDPGERRNLAASEAAAPLKQWLEGTVKTAGAAAQPAEVTPEVRERLQALGYIGTVSQPDAGGLPDPKDEIESYARLKAGLALDQKGQHDRAVTALQSLVATRPRMVDAWEALGKAQVRAGHPRQAVQSFSKVIELNPGKAETHLALARIYVLGGKVDLARQHAEIAATKIPGEAFETLAELLMEQGRLDAAAQYAARSVAADTARFMSHFILGVAAHAAGHCDDAIARYRTADEQKRLHKRAIVRNLHARMADCLVRLGRPADAEREFLAEIQTIPSSREARVGLAMLYRSTGRDGEARAVLEGLIAAQPSPDAEAYWAVVRTLRVLGDVAGAGEWAARARAKFPGDPRFQRQNPKN